MKKKDLKALQRQFPIGTKVRCYPGSRRPEAHSFESETLSDVMLMGGHTAGAYVRKPNGGSDFIAATHMEAVA